MRSSTRVAALVLAASLAAACNGGDPAGEATAPPIGNPTLEATEPAPTPTPTPTEVAAEDWTVPDDIDPAYVERVLNRLDETYLAAYRESRRAEDITAEVVDLISAIFEEADVDPVLGSLVQMRDREYEGMRPLGEERPRGFEVTEVLVASTSCIHARVLIDNSPVRDEQVEPTVNFVALARTDEGPTNPTGWHYTYQATVSDTQTEETLRASELCDA